MPHHQPPHPRENMSSQNHQPLTNVFDYRPCQSLFVPVGFELMTLKTLLVSHGNSFEEFLDDFTTIFKIRQATQLEYLIFKNEVMFGGYLVRTPNQNTLNALSTLLDAVFHSFKTHLNSERLYTAGRFDFSVNKATNYGILLAAT